MIPPDKTNEELKHELQILQKEFDSLKILYKEALSSRHISERNLNKTAELVKDNNSRFELASAAIGMAWWNMDVPSGNVVFSKRKAEMLGYLPERFHHYKDFTDILHPEDYDVTIKAMRDHIAGLTPTYDNIYRILTASGDYKWFHDVGTVVKKDSHGLPLKIIGFVIDIDTRVKAELEIKLKNEQLQKGEAKYRGLVENIVEVIYEIDGLGFITYISPSVGKLSGNTPDEIIGKNISSLILEKDDFLETGIEKLRKENELHSESRIYNKAGEERWIQYSIKAVFENGVFTGGSGILIDISEKKRAELAMQKSEEKYRFIAENISDVIWVQNFTNNKLTYISPSVFKLRGFTPEEVLQQEMDEIITPDSVEKVKRLIPVTLNKFLADPEGQKDYVEELQQICKDGSLVWTESINKYQFNADGDIELHGVLRNIEKRKQAELQLKKYAEELKLSEEKFFKIFNLSPVLMAIINPDTKLIIDVNRRMFETLGFSKEEMIGKQADELGVFYDDFQRQKIRKMSPRGENTRDLQVTVKSKSGKIIHILLSVNKIKINDIDYVLSTGVDIDQIKKNEHEIKHLHVQQKLLADISQLLIRPVELKAVLHEVLQIVGIHTGVSRVYIFEDIKNGDATSNTYEWCKEGITPQIDLLQEIPYKKIPSWKKIFSREGLILSENINDLPNDLLKFLEPQDIKSILVYPLNVENSFFGFIGYDECEKNKTWSRDEVELLRTVSNIISNSFERKLVIEKLGYSELRLKLAIESANEGLWDWNIEKGDLFFSDFWYKMRGYITLEERPKVSGWHEIVYDEDRPGMMEALNKHLSGETEYYEAIYRVNTKDGSLKWFLDHGMIVERDTDGEPVRIMGMNIDITRQKENEILLQESIETQQKLFSIIAHDLRGPLGNFMQVLELLTNGRVSDEKLKNRFLDELKKASGTAFSLLENLLNWSRSNTNTINIEPWHHNISKLLNENVEQVLYLANQKSINILVQADDHLTVFCDRDSVNIVIRNLLSNAIKFTNDHGTVKLTVKDTGSNVEIEVADTGVGIGKDILSKLFKYGSFHSTYGTKRESGSGIGLLLCKDFIERNGGTIHAESELGEGSRFIFSLPKN